MLHCFHFPFAGLMVDGLAGLWHRVCVHLQPLRIAVHARTLASSVRRRLPLPAPSTILPAVTPTMILTSVATCPPKLLPLRPSTRGARLLPASPVPEICSVRCCTACSSPNLPSSLPRGQMVRLGEEGRGDGCPGRAHGRPLEARPEGRRGGPARPSPTPSPPPARHAAPLSGNYGAHPDRIRGPRRCPERRGQRRGRRPSLLLRAR